MSTFRSFLRGMAQAFELIPAEGPALPSRPAQRSAGLRGDVLKLRGDLERVTSDLRRAAIREQRRS